MKARLAALVIALGLVPGLLAADPPAGEGADLAALPPYQPQQGVAGTIRLWGHGSTKIDFMGKLVKRWEDGFRRYQPGVRFDYRMYGTASAIGALYAGAGDLALMGEEVFPFEAAAYERVMHHPVSQVEIATGSLDVRNFDFAQVFFVNRNNPISRMTLAQLDAIFGTEHRRGAPRNFRTWGDLGLTGAWADRPIHLYGWAFDNDFWIYLQAAIFGGSHRWNPGLREYRHIYRADGTIYDAGQQILEAVARDPDAIGISNVRYAQGGVKALALAEEPAGPYFAPTRSNLIARHYPLTRIIPAAFNGEPGRPIDPKVREFLRYLLSRDGQEAIVNDGEYLPLSSHAAREQLAKLEADYPFASAASPEPSSAPAAAAASGRILRIWGDDQMTDLVGRWEAGFRRRRPDVRFENRMMGTDTGMAGLYTGVADLAFLGREISPVETMAFAWIFRRHPLAVEVATGSLDLPGKSPAPAVLVSEGNPLNRLTLAQLDAIFGCELRRGAARPCHTWGDLGLGGAWARRPIHAYLRDVDSGTAVFFRQVVLQDSRKWDWENVVEFQDLKRPDGTVVDADAQIAAAVAGDPGGIGISHAGYRGAGIKTLALAEGDGGKWVAPSRQSLTDRSYPLARAIGAYLNRSPGHPVDAEVRAFLEYVLGEAGQADVARDGGFLPLPSGIARAQMDRLE